MSGHKKLSKKIFPNSWVLASRARPCAARTRLFGLITTPNGALRAPRPSQLRCSPQNKKINYFQKQNVFLQAQTRAARGIYFSTGLICTLLSYAAPYWATLHPRELRCTPVSYAAPPWATLHPRELRCTLLSYAAPYWATLHTKSYAAPFWAKLPPSELRCTLLSYALPFWATLHPTELRWTLIELRCTQKNIFPPPPIAASLFLSAKLIL